MKKFINAIIITSILTLLFAGCAQSYEFSTRTGDGFTLKPQIASSFDDYTPAEGKEFLLFNLSSTDRGMTIDKMADSFRPNEYNPGPEAIVAGTAYKLKYIAYGKGTPPSCVLIYEVPLGTKDLEAIILELH